MDKKKVLFITTQFPYNLDNGGKIGAFNGISVIAPNFSVTVLSFSEEAKYIEEGISYFLKKLPLVVFERPVLHDIHIRHQKLKLVNAILKGYIKGVPYIASKFISDAMYRKIDEKFQKKYYWDYIFVDYLNMSVYGNYIEKNYKNRYGKMILKDHNIEYELVKQECDSSSLLKKCILIPEWMRTRKYEINQIKNADYVFSVCDSNTNWMKQYNQRCFTMFPTYEMLKIEREMPSNHNILYMGNLSWKSNMEGLEWFVRKAFPLVCDVIPDAKLTIVGSGPSANIFKNHPNINYLGYVKDIQHIYDDQSIFIVPLFDGSGIRIKILEAFNNEIPVVSTLLACETIGAENGKDIIIADSAEDFANSIVELFDNYQLRKDMVKNAKDFLNRRFSLSVRQMEFLRCLEEDER